MNYFIIIRTESVCSSVHSTHFHLSSTTRIDSFNALTTVGGGCVEEELFANYYYYTFFARLSWHGTALVGDYDYYIYIKDPLGE